MSDTIISQIPVLDQSYDDERDLKGWVPIIIAPDSRLRVKAEIRVNTIQLKALVLWADRTAGDPFTPRRPAEIFAAPEETRLRCLGYKLYEKCILKRRENGYVLTWAARDHARRYRDQVLEKA